MVNKILYELPMFSTLLTEPPKIEFKDLSAKIFFKGYDCDDMYYEVMLKFTDIIQFVVTKSIFADSLEAYDKVIQIENSENLRTLENNNTELFKSINSIGPIQHLSLFSEGYGYYQIICRHFEVIEL